MGMVINHNISAINTRRNLNISNGSMNKSLQKLSSGYRINVGADGPADLVISEQLRAQTVGLERAVRNTMEASNVIGIAEGALNEMNNILKTMRSLALHAANDGITSTEQIAADQAEVDSSIQTLDRIANTTKYSSEFLLNGNQSLTYDRTTVVKGTNNNSLLDLAASRIDQIARLEDNKITIAFNGTDNADATNSIGKANISKETTKAYFEIDSNNADVDIDNNGKLDKSQSFVVSGSKGSRQYSFDKGSSMGQIAAAIDSWSDSTGVDATLIFASDQTFEHVEGSAAGAARSNAPSGNDEDYITAALFGGEEDFGAFAAAGASARTIGSAFFSNTTLSDGSTVLAEKLSDAANNAVVLNDTWVLGQNTDGDGRVYVKITGQDTYELYKDQSLSEESKVGHGTIGNDAAAANAGTFTADNESGLSTFRLNGHGTNNLFTTASVGHVMTLNLYGMEGTQGATIDYTGIFAAAGSNNTFDEARTMTAGVRLGENTDTEGTIYYKVLKTGADTGTVYAYKDAKMADEDLVAKSLDDVTLHTTSAGTEDLVNTIILHEVRNEEDTEGTGLSIALAIDTADAGAAGADLGFVGAAGTEFTGTMSFNQLGVRISSQDYGADEYVRIQQDTGTLWQYYEEPDSTSATVIDASQGGVTVQRNGTDATLNVNGTAVKTNGLDLDLSSNDLTAKIRFNEGEVGSTTIAQVGYTSGGFATMAGALTLNSATDAASAGMTETATGGRAALTNVGGVMFNAGHSTIEQLSNFTGGMQFQLGEGSGDQERTVYSIQSMDVSNLGRVSFTEAFDEGSSVIETRTLSMQDVLGGGVAALGVDPVKALEIIDQAIDDVSTLRARLGAFQSNMLQTNANSLNVAIENITATESSIRDADMAYETAEFTKNQILVQAGTAMLAQANASSQNVLQLLG